MNDVAVLFARRRSVYLSLPGCDVWCEQRDARRWPGGAPVVAHPPCRAWGRLKAFAKPAAGEADLANFAVEQVRRWGGVLEHPAASSLFKVAGLPRPMEPPDCYGGVTIEVNQVDWGHRALKPTWLYLVRVDFAGVVMPAPGCPVTTVENMGRPEREATPRAFALWLRDLAATARPLE
ncbi:hypothetical protein [Albidovulum sp.]|uniref:hypothetical protein n=1 Tax=Albidovulum sp. TaxID=1872424 RepID=UPI0039B9C63B